MTQTLTARSVKAVLPLDADELSRLTAVDGQPRTVLRIRLPDNSMIAADIATKSLRKAIATVRDNGPDNCVTFIQGKLAGGKLSEAGLVAQAKVPASRGDPINGGGGQGV